MFRRQPAISEFDQHFTPIHRSSKVIATTTGSALRKILQPAHEQITRFRVHTYIHRPIKTRFHCDFRLAYNYDQQIHYTKGTTLSVCFYCRFQYFFHPAQQAFQFSLTLLVRYRSKFVICLGSQYSHVRVRTTLLCLNILF